MKLYFLGHSELIIELKNNKNQSIRILNDVWLSNYAFGDFLQRNPLWKWNSNFLGRIDFIFLSHPHCDHFDPYSLYWIYKHQKPDIILPENMYWAESLIKKYLNPVNIIIIENNKPIKLKNIEFTGITFFHNYETNEKDVMTLFISNDEEIVFLEEDCAIPEKKEYYEILYYQFSKKNYKNRIYICVRNELEGFFLATDEGSNIKRKEKISHYLQKRKKEIEWEYYKFYDYNLPNLYKLKNFIKIYTGQGMIYPIELNQELLKISSPLSLKQIVQIENKIQKKYKKNISVFFHEPGYVYGFKNGNLVKKELFSEDYKYYEIDFQSLNFTKYIKDEPVFNQFRDIEKQRILIKKLLERLYVYLNSYPEVPIIDLFKNQYCIEIRYGTKENYKTTYYYLHFLHYGFRETDKNIIKPWEIYWANDLEDYYYGRLDQFSSILLDLTTFRSFYFWTMLGIPYLNNDIVKNKLTFHFKRALENLSVDDYVLPVLKNKIKIKRLDFV
ncbi:MAG: hypothetical protein KatS3mg129_1801 [Leptospiraceae bacterium]|nr:MAG: hypothetical protein KatS3mg129_1801 [Leptospiraceae bacterium]